MKEQDSYSKAASEGAWPMLPEERKWKTGPIILVMISSGFASWSYVIGGYVANYLGAVAGTIAMLTGSMVGMLMVLYAGAPCSVKYGIDITGASKVQFGPKGSLLGIAFQYLSVAGWNCMLMLLLGRSVGAGLVLFGVIPESAESIVSTIACEVGLVLIWLTLRKGATAIMNFAKYLAIIIAVFAVAVFIFVVYLYGWDGIVSAQPVYAYPDKLANYTLGFEILVASLTSWWAYIGGLTRMTGKPNRASWPGMFCLGLGTGVISLIGLYSALVTGSPYPTDYLLAMAEEGGLSGFTLVFTAVCLVFLIVASVSITVTGAYSAGLGLKSIKSMEKVSWSTTSAIVLIPSFIICAVAPSWFSDNSGVFLALVGMVFGPLCGIMGIDYMLMRKQKIDIRGIYNDGPTSPYYYWKGVNPAAIIGFACGIACYLSLLNPVTYEYHGPFKYISATLPAFIVSAVIYWLISLWQIKHKNWGGYEKKVKQDK